MTNQEAPWLLYTGFVTAIIPTAILALYFNPLCIVPFVVGILVFCLGWRKWNSSKIRLPVIVLVAVAWFGPFLLSIYLSRPGSPIEFIVPARFSGTIEVVLDRKSGQDLRFEQGRYVFVIPSSGVLRVKEAFPFHRWHKETCRDFDGQPKDLEGGGMTGGSRQVGPNGWKSSSDFDGTTYRWEVH
ncbi:MAG TPA: hypothetical protein VHY20_13945 [Pirellulales bacterium]|nr:hypothetical protein [Pirellulales bacterium]